MSVQAKRRTSSQKKRRASHFALKKTHITQCAACGADALSHRVCASCGAYPKKKAGSAQKESKKKK